MMDGQDDMSEGMDGFEMDGGLAGEIAEATETITEALSEMGDRLSVAVKIMVGYLQVFSSVTITLPNIPWPGSFKNIIGAVAPVNLDFARIFPLACYVSSTGYDIFVFHTMLPLMVGGAIMLLALIKRNMVDDIEEDIATIDAMWSKILIMLFIMYPMISQQAFLIFQCEQIGPSAYYLVADLRLECYTEEWNFYAILAGVSIVVYAIGIPVFCFLILYLNAEQLTEEHTGDEDKEWERGWIYVSPESANIRYALLYEGYSACFYYGELLDMLRKLLLTGMVMFLWPGSVIQSGVFLFLCGIFLFVHLKFEPFEEESDNSIAWWTHVGLTCTIFCGVMLQMSLCELKRDVSGMSDMSMAFFAVVLLFMNIMVMLAVTWISISSVVYRQIRIIYIMVALITRYTANMVANAVLGKSKAAKEADVGHPSSHEKWLQEVADELQDYYGSSKHQVATSEGVSRLTLVCFARLLASWDSKMTIDDINLLMSCVKSQEHPWMISVSAFNLFVAWMFGAFDEKRCVDALTELMPKTNEGGVSTQRAQELQGVIDGWLGEQKQGAVTKMGGSLLVQTWALQMMSSYKESNGSYEELTGLVMSDIVTALGDESEAALMCGDMDKYWDEWELEKWLEKKRSSADSQQSLMSSLFEVLAPIGIGSTHGSAGQALLRADEAILDAALVRVSIASQAGRSLMQRARLSMSGVSDDAFIARLRAKAQSIETMETIRQNAKLLRGLNDPSFDSTKKKSQEKPKKKVVKAEEICVGEGEASTGWSESHFDKIFDRYDLDGSGRLTYADQEELSHVTTALIHKMELNVKPVDIDRRVAGRAWSDTDLSKSEYRRWFIREFVPGGAKILGKEDLLRKNRIMKEAKLKANACLPEDLSKTMEGLVVNEEEMRKIRVEKKAAERAAERKKAKEEAIKEEVAREAADKEQAAKEAANKEKATKAAAKKEAVAAKRAMKEAATAKAAVEKEAAEKEAAAKEAAENAAIQEAAIQEAAAAAAAAANEAGHVVENEVTIKKADARAAAKARLLQKRQKNVGDKPSQTSIKTEPGPPSVEIVPSSLNSDEAESKLREEAVLADLRAERQARFDAKRVASPERERPGEAEKGPEVKVEEKVEASGGNSKVMDVKARLKAKKAQRAAEKAAKEKQGGL